MWCYEILGTNELPNAAKSIMQVDSLRKIKKVGLPIEEWWDAIEDRSLQLKGDQESTRKKAKAANEDEEELDSFQDVLRWMQKDVDSKITEMEEWITERLKEYEKTSNCNLTEEESKMWLNYDSNLVSKNISPVTRE